MKMIEDRPYADPEKAARKLMQIAFEVEPVQGRIHIEKINGPMLFREGARPKEYWAGLQMKAADRSSVSISAALQRSLKGWTGVRILAESRRGSDRSLAPRVASNSCGPFIPLERPP